MIILYSFFSLYFFFSHTIIVQKKDTICKRLRVRLPFSLSFNSPDNELVHARRQSIRE